MLSGILTAFLIVLFIGLFFWAYSPRRRQRFDEAARLALVEDARRKEPLP